MTTLSEVPRKKGQGLRHFLVRLPGSSSPTGIELNSYLTTSQAIATISRKKSIRFDHLGNFGNYELQLVVSPTVSNPGAILDPEMLVADFPLKDNDILELWESPITLEVGILMQSGSKTIPLNARSPLKTLVPILRAVFPRSDQLGTEEFYFHTADGQRALNANQSLAQQGYPASGGKMVLKTKEMIMKRPAQEAKAAVYGALLLQSILKSDKSANFKSTSKRVRWCEALGTVLYIYKKQGEKLPESVVSLEYFSCSKVVEQGQLILVLKRSRDTPFSDYRGPTMYLLKSTSPETEGELKTWFQLFKDTTIHMADKIFAVPLDDLLARPNAPLSGIPTILSSSFNYLRRHKKVEGLFRIPGDNSVIEHLREQYDQGKEVDLSDFDDVHSVASLVKLWFRLLPEPVVPYRFYERFVAVANGFAEKNPEMFDDSVIGLCRELPASHFKILMYLCDFLREVAVHSEENKMSTENLARCFGPTVLRPEDEDEATGFESLNNAKNQIGIFLALLDRYERILNAGIEHAAAGERTSGGLSRPPARAPPAPPSPVLEHFSEWIAAALPRRDAELPAPPAGPPPPISRVLARPTPNQYDSAEDEDEAASLPEEGEMARKAAVVRQIQDIKGAAETTERRKRKDKPSRSRSQTKAATDDRERLEERISALLKMVVEVQEQQLADSIRVRKLEQTALELNDALEAERVARKQMASNIRDILKAEIDQRKALADLVRPLLDH